jgi:plasmid maintenance system antidote protein VapI
MRTDRANELLKRVEQTGRFRSAKNWLAEECGIETASLIHILSGRREPSRPVIILMAKALQTSPEFLNGESDTEIPPPEHKASAG